MRVLSLKSMTHFRYSPFTYIHSHLYSAYNNHLMEKKALNVLVAIRDVRRVEDFKANKAWKSIVVWHSKALADRMACHRVCAKRLAALLFPCFIAAWCSPPLITCTRMLEASKWRTRNALFFQIHVKLKLNRPKGKGRGKWCVSLSGACLHKVSKGILVKILSFFTSFYTTTTNTTSILAQMTYLNC